MRKPAFKVGQVVFIISRRQYGKVVHTFFRGGQHPKRWYTVHLKQQDDPGCTDSWTYCPRDMIRALTKREMGL